MSEGHSANVEWIIANAINEQARGDPNALAPHIIAALEKAGYCITPEDTELGSQPFDELTSEMRPQDIHGDGRDWKFETSERGGDEPDTTGAKARLFAGSVSLDETRERDILATSRLALAAFL